MQIVGFNFLNNTGSRNAVRLAIIFVYFLIFQFLIFMQKPFLQLNFIIVFYLAFSGLFIHHLVGQFKLESAKKTKVFSYIFDFLILMLFMKYFAYLSSFILVLQLFLLFIASFDLDFFELSLLGFVASLGTSLINLTSMQSGAVQNVLTLTLFNLSYFSVILVSWQLKNEFSFLQTDLNLTRRKWKSQAEFSKTLLEKLPFGLAVVNDEKEIVLENSYLTGVLNINTSELQNIINDKKINVGVSHDIMFKSKKSDITKIFNLDQSQYFDEEIESNLDLYLIKDVTLERALQKQLQQNEKLAAVGTLAAGIAHEIRNPLAGISGSIQLLSQDSNDPTQKKLMNIVLREIDRLNQLITEFLDYAKPEKTPDTAIDLAIITEQVVKSLQHHPDVSANFIWAINLEKCLILGISEKIKQALLNIIINSIQAMKNSRQQQIEINLKSVAGAAYLRIKDFGAGMSAETKQKMFEPFHTTKPKGTGLGLAVTHKILELHKAQIEVNSEIDLGTEFIIKIPLFEGDIQESI